MRLNEIYKNSATPAISYEIFPPDNEDKLQNDLSLELKKLAKFNPSFISLTCSTKHKDNNREIEVLKFLNEHFKFCLMPHFTCICNSKENVIKNLERIKALDVENILALRGDEPEDTDICYTDFHYANELVKFIRQETDFSIGVAGYPEGHISSPNLKSDIENLKKKVDEGADTIFTQLFFDNEKFYSYVELVRQKGINLPIIPGIMPIISYKQIQKMTHLAKITIPKNLQKQIEKYKDNPEDMKEMGAEFASKQCADLLKSKVQGLHFYTLDRAYSTCKILENIL